jgi:hypothetical protein
MPHPNPLLPQASFQVEGGNSQTKRNVHPLKILERIQNRKVAVFPAKGFEMMEFSVAASFPKFAALEKFIPTECLPAICIFRYTNKGALLYNRKNKKDEK